MLALNRFARSSPRQFNLLLPLAAWLLAIGIAAWVAARWTWAFMAPPTTTATHVPLTDPVQAAGEVASRHLFGIPAPVPTLRADGQPAAAIPEVVRFQLIGVAAHSGRSRGFAILQEGSQPPVAVIEGEEVAPGIKLTKVWPRAVELSRSGVTETLRLTEGKENEGIVPVPLPAPASVVPPQIQPLPPQSSAPGETVSAPTGGPPAVVRGRQPMLTPQPPTD